MKENKISNKISFAILSFLLVLVLTSHAFATTYCVSTSGSDSNPGTSGSPWETIQKAAKTMVAGDTVIVYAGTYSEAVTASTSGISSNRITYRVNTGDTVTVNKFVLSGSYITLDGFTVTNTASGWGIAGIYISGSYVIVQNCKPLSNNCPGIYTDAASSYCQLLSNYIKDSGWVGIELRGMHHTVDNNEIDGVTDIKGGFNYTDSNAMDAFGGYHTISRNYMHGVAQTGGAHLDCIQTFDRLAVDGGRALNNTVIERNLFVHYQPSAHFTLMLEGTASYPPSYLTIRNNIFKVTSGINSAAAYYGNTFKIYNNTFIGNPSETGYAISLHGVTNLDIKNNIYVDFRGVVYSLTGNTNQTVDYEHAWNQGAAISWGDVTPTHRLTSNPVFVNFVAGPRANGDYHLTSSSPGKDWGGDLTGVVTNDYHGVSRPQGAGYDLGAYEKTEEGTPPLPPTGLKVIP
jgi:hypothetical protein